jgi:enamine deaminase RidA (YjgF/YER057c/UK114 family)
MANAKPRTTPRKRRIVSPKVSEPDPGLWSNCYRVGDQVFMAGMVAWNAERKLVGGADPYAQSVQAFKNMKALIEAAGGTMRDIVKITCYLTDIRFRPAFVKARRQFFKGNFPCAVVVGSVTLASADLLVEIDAIGIVGAGR